MSEEQNIEESQKSGDRSQEETHGSETESRRTSIPNEELATENFKPETENMEVHHHPDLHHKKKNFKQYFLEFLMIFLAVTMGFFAENLREYFTDREKENKYMHSLAEDLKKDTAAIHKSITRLQWDVNSAHRLIVLVAKNQFKVQDDKTIGETSLDAGHSVDIVFNDRTSSQLKSSGSMRLIRHKNIADSILQYWNNQIVADQIHDRFETIRIEQHKIGYKTFSWYKYFFYPGAMGADSTLVSGMPVKAIINSDNLNEFLNVSSNLFNSGVFQYMPILNKQLLLASELIGQIQKEYPSENE